MKNLLLILFLCFSISSYGQQSPHSIYIGYTKAQIKAKEKIKKAQKELQEGIDFCTVFEKYSDNTLFWKCGKISSTGEMPRTRYFYNTLKNLPLGTISDIVQSQFGFHLFKKEKINDTIIYREILVSVSDTNSESE